MFGFSGPWEIGLVVLLVVILFGTKKLPELGSGMGKAINNFRKSYKEADAIDVTPEPEEISKEKQTESPPAGE